VAFICRPTDKAPMHHYSNIGSVALSCCSGTTY